MEPAKTSEFCRFIASFKRIFSEESNQSKYSAEMSADQHLFKKENYYQLLLLCVYKWKFKREKFSFSWFLFVFFLKQILRTKKNKNEAYNTNQV